MGTDTKYRQLGRLVGRCPVDIGDSPRNKFGQTLDLDHDGGEARLVAHGEDVLSMAVNRALFALGVNNDLFYQLANRAAIRWSLVTLANPISGTSTVNLRDLFYGLGWDPLPWVFIGDSSIQYASILLPFGEKGPVIDADGNIVYVTGLTSNNSDPRSNNLLVTHNIHDNGIGRYYIRKVTAGNSFSADNIQPGAWAEISNIVPEAYSSINGYYPVLGVDGDYLYLGTRVGASIPPDHSYDTAGNVIHKPISEVIAQLESASPLVISGYPVENPPGTGGNPRGTVKVYAGQFYPVGRSSSSDDLIATLSSSPASDCPIVGFVVGLMKWAALPSSIKEVDPYAFQTAVQTEAGISLDRAYRGKSFINEGISPAEGRYVFVDKGAVVLTGSPVQASDPLPSVFRIESSDSSSSGFLDIIVGTNGFDLRLRPVTDSPVNAIANPTGTTPYRIYFSDPPPDLYDKAHASFEYDAAREIPGTVIKVTYSQVVHWLTVRRKGSDAQGYYLELGNLLGGLTGLPQNTQVVCSSFEPVVYEGPGYAGSPVFAVSEPRDANYLSSRASNKASLFTINGYFVNLPDYAITPIFQVLYGPTFGPLNKTPFAGVLVSPTQFWVLQDPGKFLYPEHPEDNANKEILLVTDSEFNFDTREVSQDGYIHIRSGGGTLIKSRGKVTVSSISDDVSVETQLTKFVTISSGLESESPYAYAKIGNGQAVAYATARSSIGLHGLDGYVEVFEFNNEPWATVDASHITLKSHVDNDYRNIQFEGIARYPTVAANIGNGSVTCHAIAGRLIFDAHDLYDPDHLTYDVTVLNSYCTGNRFPLVFLEDTVSQASVKPILLYPTRVTSSPAGFVFTIRYVGNGSDTTSGLVARFVLIEHSA